MKTKSPSDRELHTVSSLVTMGVIGLTAFIIAGVGTDLAGAERDSGLDKAMRIEAAIAFKKPDKKKKQPQKRKKKKFKKPEQTFSRDEKADPVDEKDKPRTDPDEIDPLSVLEKNRQLQQDDNLSDTGSEEIVDEGALFGSEWGSGDKNKGDPYVGELKARIERTFENQPPMPAGKTVWGCLKLHPDGKIAETDVPEDGKSDDPNVNLAMETTLKTVPPMDKPVPAHLTKLLTEMGVCFRVKTK